MFKQFVIIISILSNFCQSIPQLKLVHVVFTHKSYAPFSKVLNNTEFYLPRNLTYEYFESKATDMPHGGKLNMYNLGVHLREEYDEFLGKLYTDKVMKMRTSDTVLSKMAGQLVSAGLWQPEGDQRWNEEINWQPTPADYVSKEKDTLLLGMRCPSFTAKKRVILHTDDVQEILSSYSSLFEYISQHSGMKIQQPSDVVLLYRSLETKADMREILPHWASEIFPHGGMYNLTLFEYDLLTYTSLQRQLNGGTLLKEILSNSAKFAHGDIPKGRKIMLYSGNEENIVGLLKNLNLWSPHIPNEAAALIFELYHDNTTDTHGIKIKYYTGIDGDTIELRLQNCEDICPLKSFLTMFFYALPEIESNLCNLHERGNDIQLISNFKSRATVNKPLLIIFWPLVIILYSSRLCF